MSIPVECGFNYCILYLARILHWVDVCLPLMINQSLRCHYTNCTATQTEYAVSSSLTQSDLMMKQNFSTNANCLALHNVICFCGNVATKSNRATLVELTRATAMQVYIGTGSNQYRKWIENTTWNVLGMHA